MARKVLPEGLEPPVCSCGKITWFQGEGRYRAKDDVEREDEWYRFRCPDYWKSGGKDGHFHGTVDRKGSLVTLPRRRFKYPTGARPNCETCGQPMRRGKSRRFACGNSECSQVARVKTYRLNARREWELSTTRGREREPVRPDDTCPREQGGCGQRGTLRRCGHAKPSQEHPRFAPKIRCLNCKSTFRLIEGALVRMLNPGFQPKTETTPSRRACPTHKRTLAVSWYKRQGVVGGRVFVGRCPLVWAKPRRCGYVTRWFADGSPFVDPRPRVRGAVALLMCHMPGCNRPRRDQYRANRRFCDEHQALTRVQRHRLVRRRRREEHGKYGPRVKGVAIIESIPKGQHIEFALWLRHWIRRGGLSIEETARRAGKPGTTLSNWTEGISAPRSAAKFEPVGKVLGVSFDDFSIHLRQESESRGRAKPRAASVAATSA